MLRRVAFSKAAMSVCGFLLASYGRLVRRTNALTHTPPGSFHEPFDHGPAIIALWHGEHFLLPFLSERAEKLNVLVTLHRDGEIVARAGRRFGLKFIRGSGDHGPDFMRKKPVQAFMAMLRLLQRGEVVVMTADVPKVSRVAGLGIVTLAKHAGCQIVPVAMATSRHFRLSNWDRTPISLPFGRMIMVRGEPIRVSRDSDDAALETLRRLVEQRLNDVTAQAYSLAGCEPAATAPMLARPAPKDGGAA